MSSSTTRGYFYGPCELVKEDTLNFEEQMKQIDVCALGPLRMNNALIQSKALADGCKLVIITSQAGSVEWRSTQNKDTGGDCEYFNSLSRSKVQSPCSCEKQSRSRKGKKNTNSAHSSMVSGAFVRILTDGHHMSRAACNMAAKLLSEEVKDMGYTVLMLHPGFNRTEMTAKYKEIWDVEGAVPAEEGAKRVLYETIRNGMEQTGEFINCEDGLQIPW